MIQELSIVLIALDRNSGLQSNKKITMIISSRGFPGIRIIAEKNGDESRKSVGLSLGFGHWNRDNGNLSYAKAVRLPYYVS